VILALAAFIRETAVSNDTPFDRYMRGDTAALSKSSLRGFELFKGKAGCIQCHNGAFFTDGAAYAAGVPENPALANVALRQISVRYHYARRGFKPDEIQTEGYDAGKRFATRRVQDDRAFRTPTLRELNHSAPYMHNGVFATLEDVVSFYNEGRGPLPPLGLSEEEISDLVSFLLSLSGPGVVIGQPDKPGRRLSSEEYWK
jgi:cytochrome c peroxidase